MRGAWTGAVTGALAGAAGLCGAGGVLLLADAAARHGEGLPPGTAGLEAVVGTAATASAGLLLLWLAVAGAAALVHAALTRTGRAAPRTAAVAAHVAPEVLRRAVAGALSAAVVCGTAAPALAEAAPAAGAQQSAEDVDPGWERFTPPTPPPERAAGPAPQPAPQPPPSAPPPAPEPAPARQVVVVACGDTLWAIAERALGTASDAEIAAEWPRWYDANAAVVGPDPDHIRPGMRLVPPRGRR